MALAKLCQTVFSSSLKSFRPYHIPISSYTSVQTGTTEDETTRNLCEEDDDIMKAQQIFSKIAPKYDVMNDIVSFGMHALWKNRLVSILNPNEKTNLLDCAGGTGDIAFLAKQSKASEVTVCDLNQEMLDVGQTRAKEKSLDVNWVCGNAEELPFPDDAFNSYVISFGIRFCNDIEKALSEAHRVLLPGGQFFCLELNKDMPLPGLNILRDAYALNIVPLIGEVIAGDWKSYEYLAQNNNGIPSQSEFTRMVKEAGFQSFNCETLPPGLCSIYSAVKI